MILALDIATTTGWAFGAPGSVPQWGHNRVAKPGASEGEVMLAFQKMMGDMMHFLSPMHVYAEDQYLPVASRGGKGARPDVVRRLFGFRGIANMTVAIDRKTIQWVPATTITKFFTGSGRWPEGEKKGATIRLCKLQGWDVTDDNEADALALWLYACHHSRPYDANADAAGSYYDAIAEIGRRVKAGDEPVPTTGYFGKRTRKTARTSPDMSVVAVETIRAFSRAGATFDEIQQQYPHLDSVQIAEALRCQR